jgi:hypothetical protein
MAGGAGRTGRPPGVATRVFPDAKGPAGWCYWIQEQWDDGNNYPAGLTTPYPSAKEYRWTCTGAAC